MSLLAVPLLLTTVLSDASGLERRLWEVQVRQFERLDATNEYAADSVMFFGSSSIRRWKTIEQDMAPYPVIQRGYGGARLSDAVNYVERVVHPHECRAIVLFVGNDLTGKPGDRTPSGVAELFDETIARIRARFAETPIVWVEVTPVPSRWDAYSLVREASALIRESCERDENTHFLSTSHFFLENVDGEERPIARFFQADDLHLNEAGYAIWSAAIREKLDDVLGEETPVETIPVSIEREEKATVE